MDCGEGLFVIGHYYPACPEPKLAIGTTSHADADFFTVLLQDEIGGLQILHDNYWVDVPPCPGALVINIGDLLQLITNDQFKSVNHQVLAKEMGPRISVACFFRTHFKELDKSRLYGPIKELVTDEKPQIYKETTITEFVTYHYTTDQGKSISYKKMATTNTKPDELHTEAAITTVLNGEYNRKSELEAFDNTKTGVKGLVDSGIKTLPNIFKCNNNNTNNFPSSKPKQSNKETIPVIDLKIESIRFDNDTRKKVVDEIGRASRDWGFFQVVNHGVPIKCLDDVIDGVRRFHELDNETKKSFYSRELRKKFKYNSNFDLYQAPVTNWRDTFSCIMAPVPPEPQDLPQICRDIIFEYSKEVKKLGSILLELFSEALGLESNHLKEMDCGEGLFVIGHYYPACPEPKLAIGTTSHADADFFTVLLQDEIGGLQILHDNYWVDVPPCPGALVINIGDLLQLITNDQFKSVNHRVLANEMGPRISVACFFRIHFPELNKSRMYGPIKELVTDEKPPIYKETTITEFVTYLYTTGLDGISILTHFKL